jgi:hypothetical protein
MKVKYVYGIQNRKYTGGAVQVKTIGKKEKYVFKIFANTTIIDFNHTCKIKHV